MSNVTPMGGLHAVVIVSLPSGGFFSSCTHSLVSHSPIGGHLPCSPAQAGVHEAATNIPKVVFWRCTHSFLLGTFSSVGLLGHEVCSWLILLDLCSFVKHLWSLLSFSLPIFPPCYHLKYLLPASVIKPVSLTCLLLSTGQKEGATPPAGLQDNGGPTDCEVFTLTPPPPRRNPVTRIQPVTRTPKCPFHFFPWQGPRVPIRFPHRPFLPWRCNHRFPFRPFFWPYGRLTPHYRYIPRGRLWRGSSSEESRWKREVPNMWKQKKPLAQRRL